MNTSIRARVLVTGFEPFGGHAVNPSEDVARALDGTEIAGVRVAGRVLPVVDAGLAALLSALIEETAPRAVICLGLAADASAIRLERISVNRAQFDIADNAGAIRLGSLVEDGPALRRATLPLNSIYTRLRDHGIAVELSDNAGAYVCNAAMYHALGLAGRRQPPLPCGFIHLPMLPEQAATRDGGRPGALSFEIMLDAVREATAATLESLSA